MSLNSALNVALAIIEERPEIAKEYLRAPGSDVKDIAGVIARIREAVDQAASDKIRKSLVETLALRPRTFLAGKTKPTYEEGYFEGIEAMEQKLLLVADKLAKD